MVNSKANIIQKILLILFVFIMSLLVGWYGEQAVEKFMVNNDNDSVNEVQPF